MPSRTLLHMTDTSHDMDSTSFPEETNLQVYGQTCKRNDRFVLLLSPLVRSGYWNGSPVEINPQSVGRERNVGGRLTSGNIWGPDGLVKVSPLEHGPGNRVEIFTETGG